MTLLHRLVPSNQLHYATRAISSKYPKPHPRPYLRRLFEAAVKPVMPPKVISCGMWKEVVAEKNRELESLMPIERALIDKIQKWIKEEQFRVMAICQLQPTKGNQVYLAKNQLRLNEIYYAGYNSRIMGKIFENTPLKLLKPLFDVEQNCFLFGRDLESIKAMINSTNKIPFIIPLVITVDSKILPMHEAERLAKFENLDDMRAETVQILQQIPAQLTQTLDYQAQDLVSTLSRIA